MKLLEAWKLEWSTAIEKKTMENEKMAKELEDWQNEIEKLNESNNQSVHKTEGETWLLRSQVEAKEQAESKKAEKEQEVDNLSLEIENLQNELLESKKQQSVLAEQLRSKEAEIETRAKEIE